MWKIRRAVFLRSATDRFFDIRRHSFLNNGAEAYKIAAEMSQHTTPSPSSPPEKTASFLGEGARTLITTAAAFIVLYGLKTTREVAVPIVMAIFLAIISYPITVSLRRLLRLHWLAVAFTVIVDIGVVFGLFRLVKFLAADMRVTLQSNLLQQIEIKFNAFMQWLDQWGLGEHARSLIESPQSLIDPQQILSLSQTLTGQIVSYMSLTTLVLILMTFLLGEAPLFCRNFNSLPNSIQGKSKMEAALRGIQKYLFIKTLASICTGLLAWWLCELMHVPFAFLWGFVACALNYIPTIGSIAAAVPPVLLALVLGDWGSMLVVAGGYLAINFAIGNGIEPLFLGKQFGIATSVVLLSVIVWGWVWGPFGMLLAVPFTVLTKLALENSVDLHWVAAIIADNNSSDQPNKKS